MEKGNKSNKIKWTYEACYNLALGCKLRTELKKKSGRAYEVALKNGWIDDYTWFLTKEEKLLHNRKWTYERCKEAALKFSTLLDFRKAYPSAETISRRNGWLKDFDWLKRTNNPFTSKLDNVYAYIFVNLNSVYVGRTVEPNKRDISHRKRGTVFKFSEENKVPIPKMTILEKDLSLTEGLEKEDYYRNRYEQEGWNVINIAKTGLKSGSLGTLNKRWTREKCYNEAKKYKTLKEFRENSEPAYNASLRNGWRSDYTWLALSFQKTDDKPPVYTQIKWTRELCFEEAKKYKSRSEFFEGNVTAYNISRKNNWLDDYTWFSPSKTKKLSYEFCFNEAKKYTKLSDFRKYCDSTHQIALRNGWLKDYTWLERGDIMKSILQFSIDGKFIKKFDNIVELCEETGFSSGSGVYECCNCKIRYYMGYLWCYEGEENIIKDKVKSMIYVYGKDFSLVNYFLTINKASRTYNPKHATFNTILKYIDTGKLAPDGHYYYHGPHKFTDDEQNKNQDPDNNI